MEFTANQDRSADIGGASHEGFGDERYLTGFPVNGMELQPEWDIVHRRGKRAPTPLERIPEKEVVDMRKRVYGCGMPVTRLAMKLGTYDNAIYNALKNPIQSNATFKLLRQYFGLEGA